MANARRSGPQLGYATSALEAARGADVVMLLTEWPEFTGLEPAQLADVVARRNIIDGRNVLDPRGHLRRRRIRLACPILSDEILN